MANKVQWAPGQEGGRVDIGYAEPAPNWFERYGLPAVANALSRVETMEERAAKMAMASKEQDAAMARVMAEIAGAKDVAKLGAEQRAAEAQDERYMKMWVSYMTQDENWRTQWVDPKTNKVKKKPSGLLRAAWKPTVWVRPSRWPQTILPPIRL